MSDQSGSPPTRDEDSSPAPLALGDEKVDLEQGRGPQEAVDETETSPSDSPKQRPRKGSFLGLDDSFDNSGESTGLGLDLDFVGGGSTEDEAQDEYPMRPIPSTQSMRSAGAASGYVRRPSIHDTTAIDTLRQSLSSVRLSRPASMASMASNQGGLSRPTSMTSMASRKGSKNDDVEAQDRQEIEEEEEEDPHSKRFRQAIVNACHDAFGILGVDVWLHDEEDGSFYHAPGGYYRHESYKPKGYKENMALERIEDENCVNFVPPTRQVPGAGLAGEFWIFGGYTRRHPFPFTHRPSAPRERKATSGRRELRPTATTSLERNAKIETSGAIRPPSSTTPTSRRTLVWPC